MESQEQKIRRLQQELKQKDRTIEKKDKALEKKNRKLAQKDETLEKKNKKLAQKDRKLEQKDKTITSLRSTIDDEESLWKASAGINRVKVVPPILHSREIICDIL